MTDTLTPAREPGTTAALEPEQRREIVVHLDGVEWRDSGDPERKNITTMRGHAAVFNSLSDDLGGFREIIEPGFFRSALRKKPDVRALFNHDPNYVLGRTAAGTVDLREDKQGLHVFAEVDKSISWVADLRKSMQRGDIDQMSFAFTISEGGDDWAVTDDGTVVRTLRADGADELFDVSVVTYPAYRATHVDMRSVYERAVQEGRVPLEGRAEGSIADPETEIESAGEQGEPEDATTSPDEGESTGEGVEATEVAPAEEPLEGDGESPLDQLRNRTRGAARAERESYLRLLGEMIK